MRLVRSYNLCARGDPGRACQGSVLVRQILDSGDQRFLVELAARFAPLFRVLAFPAFLAAPAGRHRLGHGLDAEGGDGGAGLEEAGRLELLDAGQGVAALQPEMVEEGVGGDPGDRPPGRAPPPLGADPAGLQQGVERTARVSMAARESLRGTSVSICMRGARSAAVRNAQRPSRCTRLTPRFA